jgi:hypothetical protein
MQQRALRVKKDINKSLINSVFSVSVVNNDKYMR